MLGDLYACLQDLESTLEAAKATQDVWQTAMAEESAHAAAAQAMLDPLSGPQLPC